MNFPLAWRREALVGAASVAAASVLVADKSASAASGVGGINAIPELAPQWKELDLAEILSRPAAYMSVSQNKSLYDFGGVQAGEKHRERGSLPATVKVVTPARKAPNFKSFNWIGYEVFRESYPQTGPVRELGEGTELYAGNEKEGWRAGWRTARAGPAGGQRGQRTGAAD